MDVLAVIKSVSPVRTLQGVNGQEVKVVDVAVSLGCDQFVMSAFDKVVEKFEKQEIKVGTFCQIQAQAAIREKDGKQFQSLRIMAISPFN